jgi:hypothetical protein
MLLLKLLLLYCLNGFKRNHKIRGDLWSHTDDTPAQRIDTDHDSNLKAFKKKEALSDGKYKSRYTGFAMRCAPSSA